MQIMTCSGMGFDEMRRFLHIEIVLVTEQEDMIGLSL